VKKRQKIIFDTGKKAKLSKLAIFKGRARSLLQKNPLWFGHQ